MARIDQGSCVGIYYFVGNQIEVHNGRLIGARYGQNWVAYVDTNVRPDEVLFAHWNIDSRGIPFHERRRLSRIVEVRITPDLPQNNAFYCAQFRGISPGINILPGTCVGIWFQDDNGRLDVKNGRYLFWLDRNRQRHCVIQPSVTPYEIFYYHWIIQRNSAGQITGLNPEIKSRTMLRDVFRNTL